MLALVRQAESRTPYAADLDATRRWPPRARPTKRSDEGSLPAPGAGVGDLSRRGFRANDGLVSTSLWPGVSGGGVSTNTILLTGLLGLSPPQLSMGAGEWISVRSQRELLTASAPSLGAHHVVPHLDVDANELALVYRARGMPADESERRAEEVLRTQDALYETTSTEALDAVGSDLAAGLSSFAFFASGAAVPVLPFAFGLSETPALIVACVLVGLALLVTGAIVGVLSGGPPLRRALRQLAIGLGAAAITYAVGSLAGLARTGYLPCQHASACALTEEQRFSAGTVRGPRRSGR